jgi:hypothetical protein
MSGCLMRKIRLILAALFVGMAAATVVRAATVDRHSPITLAATKTGKERLSDKGSDEQRTDDCKVSPAQRTRARPTNCPWDSVGGNQQPRPAGPESPNRQ